MEINNTNSLKILQNKRNVHVCGQLGVLMHAIHELTMTMGCSLTMTEIIFTFSGGISFVFFPGK